MKDDDKKPDSDAKVEDILTEARERFEDSFDRDKENRSASKNDREFIRIPGKQWDKDVKDRWGDDETLEFPQLSQFTAQIINEQRQNRPGISVHPAGGDASEDVAEILQGMVRHIEYASQAEAAYDTAFEHAVEGGRGFWRVITEYESPKSFNQVLKIKGIDDPNTVFVDPDFQAPDGSDIEYAFVIDEMPKSKFEEKYPDAEPSSWDGGGSLEKWFPKKDTIIVADYLRRVCMKRVLVMMSDGNIFWEDEIPAGIVMPPGVTEIARREAEDYRVEWYKIAGGEQILEEIDWPGTIIPIIQCMGESTVIEGKRTFQGAIRRAKDAQRMYNYEKSMKATHLMLSTLAPYIAAEGAIEGYEAMWKSANRARFSTLVYKNTDNNGNPIPPPQRTMPPQVPTGYVEAGQSDKEDMKSIIGMYNNSLGMTGQEVSGRAILARQKQGDNSTFHFVDNMSRAIALTGRILLELIPTYYDQKRLVTVIDKDDSRRMTTINAPQPEQVDPMTGAVQAIVENDVTVGEYAVTVEAGPSYATAREHTREAMMALVQADPAILQVGGDLIVKAMDFPDAEDLAERMQAVMPPPIQALIQAKKKNEDPQVAALTQQLQQLQQQAQQAMQQMQQQAGQAVQQAQGEAQKAQASLFDLQQQIAALQIQLKNREDEASLRALEIRSAAQTKGRELDQKDRDLDLREQEIEAGLVVDLLKVQQAQPEPVAPEAMQMNQAAEAIVDPADEMLQKLAGHMSMLTDHVKGLSTMMTAPKKVVRGPDGRAMGLETVMPGPATVQ